MLFLTSKVHTVRTDKLKRLEHIARLYYEQSKSQAEIAALLGVSRPLISRMLDEARNAGIVEVRIHSKSSGDSRTLDAAKDRFGLRGGFLAPDAADDAKTNEALANAVLGLVEELGGGRVGLGWGHLIGTIVSVLEKRAAGKSAVTDVCPMVGNGGVAIRNYHSNENTRVVAQQTGAAPHFLYTPAWAETRQERELLLKTEQYKTVLKEWKRLDIALVNIGNHPSTPDFASGARFGNLLVRQRAVGRMIAYYYNENGEIIHSDHDYIIQIPWDVLSRCPRVIGICSANVSDKALRGALLTKLFTHVVTREKLMAEILDE